jgi:hypothetical protein
MMTLRSFEASISIKQSTWINVAEDLKIDVINYCVYGNEGSEIWFNICGGRKLRAFAFRASAFIMHRELNFSFYMWEITEGNENN